MALARAFTSKRNKGDFSVTPRRSGSGKTNGKPIQRSQISAPTQLLSTTNMLSFNAPDIPKSSTSSLTSGYDTDSFRTLPSSPATSVDVSPVESQPGSPESSQLSTYFQLGHGSPSRKGSNSSVEGPAIPVRAPSHTRASHRAIARQRSQSRNSPPVAMPNAQEPAATAVSPHPFGKELEQVDEVAEEFGVRDTVLEEEEQFLRENGLFKFGVEEYLVEIEGLFWGGFQENMFMNSSWI